MTCLSPRHINGTDTPAGTLGGKARALLHVRSGRRRVRRYTTLPVNPDSGLDWLVR